MYPAPAPSSPDRAGRRQTRTAHHLDSGVHADPEVVRRRRRQRARHRRRRGDVDAQHGHRLGAARRARQLRRRVVGVDQRLEDDLDVGAREAQHAPESRGEKNLFFCIQINFFNLKPN